MLTSYCVDAPSLYGSTPCPPEPRTILDSGDVVALFQPIKRLRDGMVVGFEALARLRCGDALLPPSAFLGSLSADGSARLFVSVMDQALTLRDALLAEGIDVYVTVNAEASLVLSGSLRAAVVRAAADHGGVDGLVVELLEGEATTDMEGLATALGEIRALGVKVAMDDIGSGYSSLSNLRSLPVDFVKLDQCFARGLHGRPADLHFVLSVQVLASALGKRLVVEGIETADILDAARILGVEYGQGYAIARPMPADAVPGWIRSRPVHERSRIPSTLLGAYASHLKVVETCRMLMSQPLPIEWGSASRDSHACAIGRYFDACGTHDGPCGTAHKRFHEVMALYDLDRAAWDAGADGFRSALEGALAGEVASRFACVAVAGAPPAPAALSARA